MLHPARSTSFAQDRLSATQGKGNSVKSSCLPCKHFSTCHLGALLPEPFGQRDPPALPAQSVSSKLLELLLGASSLDQHRDQHQCRLSSLQGKKGELRFNRKKRLQQTAQLICHPAKENKHGNSSQNPPTCCRQLPSQAPYFQHGFVPEPIFFTEFTGTPSIFTSPHCSWK